ncbi:VOC family protein [Halpernia frigidisoli]|uniref:Catechol 2,3-dioxygenase n=1 Tax=Halpernia frigidisoli TaxID=1125876 RepID=A0A1I3F1R3_9FLAO|nr:VOC family protein [Halpernia frigidisoli]SFI05225.1 Catechol 2,3-dioxygenase [Halpernia frigidisoli]
MNSKTYTEDGLKSISLYNIAFTVENIDASIKWYKDVLGFELKNKSKFSLPSGSADIAILKLGDLNLELLQVPNSKKIPEMFADVPMHLIPIGNKVIVFQVTDLNLTTQQLEEKEVKFVWKEQYIAGDKMLCTMIEDIDGNKINIFQTNTIFEDEKIENNLSAENMAKKHLQLWNEKNMELRRNAIDLIYSDYIKFLDPQINFEGKEKLNDFITDLQSKHPDHAFSLVGEVLNHHHTIKFNWEFKSEKDNSKIMGSDILYLKNGLVDKISVFIE